MKFGKYIASQQQEWVGSEYLNYKQLKQLFSSSFDLQTILNNKTIFLFALERELEKVNAFYLQKEAQYKARLHSLISKKRIVAKNIVRLVSLKDALLQFQRDLARLKSYVEVNQQGFHKILKKWDKRSKTATREIYLSRQVQIQPCFNHLVLSELTDSTTTTLAEIDSLIDNLDLSSPLLKNIESINEFYDFEADLMRTIKRGDETLMKKFISSGFSLDSAIPSHQDPDFISRLFLGVCQFASLDIISLLLKSNQVDVNFVNDINGKSCIHDVSITGRLDVLELIHVFLSNIGI